MINKFKYSSELQAKADALWQRIETDPVGVIDPPNIHHQFASKIYHGRKVDMDKIVTGSGFFWQWMETYTLWINEAYKGQRPNVLLGIAGGGNRLATTMAASVGAVGLETYKVDSKTVALTDISRLVIAQLVEKNGSIFVLEAEDVGTSGGTTSSVIPELRELGVTRVEVAHTEIRNPELKVLEEMQITYGTVIHEVLPTFSETDCQTLPEGYCNQGVLLIPHGQ